LAERLRAKALELGADAIYLPHEREMHPDHRAAVRLVRQALTEIPPAQRPQVWMFEVWTPMQSMDLIVDISPFIEAKLSAIRAYQSQCRVLKFDDAFLGLSRYRGEMHSWPGGDYAEVFRQMKL
jgi:LmbE family N-acetylglucosaminyl deacetylase